MPNVRKYRLRRKKGNRRKRLYKRKRYNRRGGSNPVAPSYYCKLRYVTYKKLDASIGAAGSQLMSCNTTRDPDHTGTGHQPLGFDQLMGLYQHCYVYKSRCTMDITPASTTSTNLGMIVGIQVVNDDSPVVAYETIAEQPYTKYKVVPAHGNVNCRLSTWWSWKKFQGGRSPFDGNNLTTTSVDPNYRNYFHIFTQTLESGVADPPPVYVAVTVTYYCKFTTPLELGQS